MNLRHRLPLLLLSLAAGCSAAGLRVQIVDNDTLALDGEELGWRELEERVRARVAEAADRGAEPPPVLLQVDPTLGARLRPAPGPPPIERLVGLLQDAGIRRLDIRR